MRYWIYLNGEVPRSYAAHELNGLPGFSQTTLVCPSEGVQEKSWRRAAEFPELAAAFEHRQGTTAPAPPVDGSSLSDVNAFLDKAEDRLLGHVARLKQQLQSSREHQALIQALQREVAALSRDLKLAHEQRLELDRLKVAAELARRELVDKDAALAKAVAIVRRLEEALAPGHPAASAPASKPTEDAARIRPLHPPSRGAAPIVPTQEPPKQAVPTQAVPTLAVAEPKPLGIDERLETLPLSAFHWRHAIRIGACYLIGLPFMAEFFPIGVLNIWKDWHLTVAQLSWIGIIPSFCSFLGGIASGQAGARWGRKPVLLATMAMMVVFNGLTGLSWDFYSLLFFRSLAWFGAGGSLAPVGVYAVEFAPAAYRGRLFSTTQILWPLGDFLGVSLGCFILPLLGWRLTFLASTLPAVYLLYLWKTLPESPRFLESVGRWEEARETTWRIEKAAGIKSPTPLVQKPRGSSASSPKASVRSLWEGGLAKRTFMLSLLAFTSNYTWLTVLQWLPLLLVMAGHPMQETPRYILFHTAVALPALFISASIMDRLGRKGTILIYLIGGAGAYLYFGLWARTALAILIFGACVRFAATGLKCGLQGYIPENYPTHVRTLGTGWASGFAGLGSISSALVVRFIATRWPGRIDFIFIQLAVLLAISATTLGLLGYETMGKTLEETGSAKRAA